MQELQPATEIFCECDEDHHDDSTAAALAEEPHVVVKQTDRSDCSLSAAPTALSSEPSFISSESECCDNEIARVAGLAMFLRMKHFDASSNLPENDDDDTHPIAELSWDDLNVGALLGSGGFSSVFRVWIRPDSAHCESLCNESYALKFLNKTRLWNKGADKLSKSASDFAMETKFLSRLNHENIIQLHGMMRGCPSVAFHDNGGFFLVLELLTETLHERLERWSTTRHHHESLLDRLESTAVGIASGMEYLHENRIIFRDLKPENCGFDASGTVKIFDLGLARELETGETMRSSVGTFRYMAPEVLLGSGYSFPCDVYSYGIILWQICSLQVKFAEQLKKKAQVLEWVVKRGGRPSLKSLSCPRRINRLIKECWQPDPQLRPAFKTIRKRLEKVIATSSYAIEYTA